LQGGEREYGESEEASGRAHRHFNVMHTAGFKMGSSQVRADPAMPRVPEPRR
jgi:hypothetical protein